MIKKFSFALVLLTALIIIGGNNPAEAREVYVGSYSDGTSVYLLTDSIQSNGRQGVQDYTCRVRAGRAYLFYHFYYGNVWIYDNNEGYSGAVYDGSSPVAAAILNYILRR